VGILDYLRGRRRRERPIGGLEITAEPSAGMRALSQGPGAEEQSAAAVEAAELGLAELGQIGAMIAKATREGSIQVHQGEAQAFELPGAGLQEEILEVMRRYGLEPGAAGASQQVDPSQMAAMQREIMDAVSRHGIDLKGYLGGDSTTD